MNRRPLVAGALAAVAVATTGLLSACGAGQLAQTAQVQPGVPGINTQAPDGRRVYVRNAALDYSGPKGYAQGANAPMSLWIFNDTEQVVTLVGVAGIQVVESDGANTAAPCAVPRTIPPAAPASATTPTANPTAPSSGSSGASAGKGKSSPSAPPSSASPSPSPSPSPSLGSAQIKVAVPAGGCVELSRRAAHYLQIVDLPRAVDNASWVPLGFAFTTEDGSNFTIGTQNAPVQLPVAVPESPLPS